MLLLAIGNQKHRPQVGSYIKAVNAGSGFDRRYETVYYFNQPGRSWYPTVRYTAAD